MSDSTDDVIATALSQARTIAVVGFSPDPARPSHGVAAFLSARGYRVLPVNPAHAGAAAFGETVCASLSAIAGPVDMVDVFRRSDQVLPVAQAALGAFRALQTLWLQIGVQNAEAAALATARGVVVIQNRCPKIEYLRLFGERPLSAIARP